MKKLFLAAMLAVSVNTAFPAEFILHLRPKESKTSLTIKALLKSVAISAGSYVGVCLAKMVVNKYSGSANPVWDITQWDERSRLSFCTTLGIMLSYVWYEGFIEKMPDK